MSESIKASEVSDVLRMQLEGIDTKLRFDEVGTVLQVSDGVVRIHADVEAVRTSNEVGVTYITVQESADGERPGPLWRPSSKRI